MKKILLTLLLLSVAGSAMAATGVRGRIAWRGELVPDLTVRAYKSIADIAAGREVAASKPSLVDGTYSLALPPGQYYMTARDYDGVPKPGNYFCYYSGSPIRVVPEHETTVGFNLVKVPEEAAPVAGVYSGIQGELSFQGEPLEKAYLYVYKDASRGFKGPGYFVQPVASGKFKLRLPPGDYYLLARKRAKGGQFGPIEIGDYFNYYYGNPVRIEKNKLVDVRLETITRMPMLEEGEGVPFSGVRGTVRDQRGMPAAGVHVFAYRDSGMTGNPDYFSKVTGSDGVFELPLPAGGDYYLLARENFGGPAVDGELYGKYAGSQDHAIQLQTGAVVQEVVIDVEAAIAQ